MKKILVIMLVISLVIGLTLGCAPTNEDKYRERDINDRNEWNQRRNINDNYRDNKYGTNDYNNMYNERFDFNNFGDTNTTKSNSIESLLDGRKECKDSETVVNGDTCYVGLDMNKNYTLSENMKDQFRKLIMKKDPSIKNVIFTSDPNECNKIKQGIQIPNNTIQNIR